MKVLIACEYTGVVRDAFIAKGHNAISCDILPTKSPGPHYQGDVMDIIDQEIDMLIAFPPCTHLAVSGARWFKQKREDGRQQQGIDFFLKIINADVDKLAVENPVGIMSTIYGKPTQIIQPWQFGDPYQKTTCLWLKGLPKLTPSGIVAETYSCRCGCNFELYLGKHGCPNCSGREKAEIGRGHFVWHGGKKFTKRLSNRKSKRDKTFPGIAAAMAAQWG